MRLFVAAALALPLLLIDLAPPAQGGWGDGGCAPAVGPVGPPPVRIAPWVMTPAPATASAVRGPGGCCSELCVCGCNAGPDAPCPCCGRAAGGAGGGSDDDPGPVGPGPTAVPNYGLDRSRIGRHGEACSVNGREVTKDELLRALSQAPTIPDDSTLLRVTVAGGTDADRQRVLAAFAAAPLGAYRDRVLIQDYPWPHWALARAGIDASAGLVVCVERPDGVKLWTGPYTTADDLADRIDPTRRPPKPGPAPAPQPAPAPAPDVNSPTTMPWCCAAAAGLIVLMVLTRRKAE